MSAAKAFPASVREARSTDCSALAELSRQLGYPVTEQQIAERLSRNSRRDSIVLVAENSAGEAMAWIQLMVRDVLVSETSAEICGLVVDSSHRGSGLGKLLIESAECWAREHGCVSISLRTNIVRNEAHQFYERLGFERYKTQFAYTKPVKPVPRDAEKLSPTRA